MTVLAAMALVVYRIEAGKRIPLLLWWWIGINGLLTVWDAAMGFPMAFESWANGLEP